MLKITLKNGKRYDALDGTAIYPSGSPNARSRMEIHMGEDAMTAVEFEAAFMDETATEEIRLTRIADEDDLAKGVKKGDMIYDTLYQHYCLVASIGKKRVSLKKCTLWSS